MKYVHTIEYTVDILRRYSTEQFSHDGQQQIANEHYTAEGYIQSWS